MTSFLARLQREKDSGRIADTMLLLGRGQGLLRDTALQAAGLLLGTTGSPQDHPDFALFDPEELQISGLKVEHVADRGKDGPCLVDALRFRPLGGGFRVVLLLGIERMTPDAQAALLKTTEEPPPQTLLILTSKNDGQILPALRSRCRVWRVDSPDSSAMQRQALGRGWTDEEFATLTAACGHPEVALEMEPSASRALLSWCHSFQSWLTEGGDPSVWLAPSLARELSGQRQELGFRFSAAMGLASQNYAFEEDPVARLRLDRLFSSLHRAVADIGGLAHPEWVREALLEEFFVTANALAEKD